VKKAIVAFSIVTPALLLTSVVLATGKNNNSSSINVNVNENTNVNKNENNIDIEIKNEQENEQTQNQTVNVSAPSFVPKVQPATGPTLAYYTAMLGALPIGLALARYRRD